jgi:hypothetical protein
VGHQFVVRGAEHSGLQQTLFDARWKLPWERSERCGTTGVFQLVVTSPVLSSDGAKVAYVETGTANGAILRILRWDADSSTDGIGGLPDQYLSAGSNWSACNPQPNSCLFGLPFSGNPAASESSPYYVYSNDTLYVGDDSGKLHKFVGIFAGTPSEVTTAPWPITLGATVLHSPVFDSGSGNIFVGDSNGNIFYVKDTGSSAGVCSTSSNGGQVPCIGTTNGASNGPTSDALGGSIDDAPIIDGSTGRVFFFNGTIPSGSTCSALGTNSAVVQTNTSLNDKVVLCIANDGTAGIITQMKSGAFDNAYLSSSAGNQTGKLYFCAKGQGDTDLPVLYRVGFNAVGKMNSALDAGSLTFVDSAGEGCSPITEVYNTATSTDWLFLSVGNHAMLGTCQVLNMGCVMSLNVTSGAFPAGITAGYPLPAGAAGPGNAGSSGIIVDNVANTATYPQASSIYFSFLSNSTAARLCNTATSVGCAVKLTQAALQ